MKITEAEFIISAVKPHQYPEDELPEIALAGRSNVGKSSLINKLLMRKALARTSSQPGKTQQLNYYRINNQLYFVDFPGYGYAKVSKTQREAWGQMIEGFLRSREPLKLVLLIIDVRHAPSKDDCLMYQWLKHFNIPLRVVVTKADKIPRSRWDKQLKLIREELEAPRSEKFVLFSSETGLGRDELWQVIADEALNQEESV